MDKQIEKLNSLLSVIETDKVTQDDLVEVMSAFLQIISELKDAVDANVSQLDKAAVAAMNELKGNLGDNEKMLRSLITEAKTTAGADLKKLSTTFAGEISRLETAIQNIKPFDASILNTRLDNLSASIGRVYEQISKIKIPPQKTPEEMAKDLNTLKSAIEPYVIKGFEDLKKIPDLERIIRNNNFDVRIGVSKTELVALQNRVTNLEREITVSATAPTNPSINDLWFDIS